VSDVTATVSKYMLPIDTINLERPPCVGEVSRTGKKHCLIDLDLI